MVTPIVTITDEETGQVLFQGCIASKGDGFTIARVADNKPARLELLASDMSARIRKLDPLPPSP